MSLTNLHTCYFFVRHTFSNYYNSVNFSARTFRFCVAVYLEVLQMMMMMTRKRMTMSWMTTMRWRATTSMTTMTSVSQLLDEIETLGFCESIKPNQKMRKTMK